VCGIIGYIGRRKVIPVLLDGLKKLEYRGYDSAGIAVMNADGLQLRRVQGKISQLEDHLKQDPIEGAYGIGHTRWATHGRPSEENAHPHQDCSGTLVVVHNGIIENYLILKQNLQREGHTFITETDTEVIAHLIEKHDQGDLESAVRRALSEMEGAFALAVVSSRDRDKIVVAKLGPPVVIGLGNNENYVSSDINPLLCHTRDIVFLKDGEMAVLERKRVRFSDFEGRALDKPSERIAWNPLMVEKRGFKHFMLKEIFEQPDVMRDTLKGRLSLDSGEVRLEEIGIPRDDLRGIRRLVIIACGTSYNAGLVGKYFIERLAGIPVDVEYASEYRYRDFILDKRSLVVVVSQSGETADTLAALRAVREHGPLTLAVCNVINSSIEREAGGFLRTHAGPEIGVAATKTFCSQMAAMSLLALYLAQIKGTLDRDVGLPFLHALQQLPHKMEIILGRAGSIENAASRYMSYNHFLFLGRWVNYPIALEGALKLKEISYIHAEGYPGGEMKHGPIALIDDGMPTMALIPRDHVYEKILSNISEIKARSGRVCAVAFDGNDSIKDQVEDVLSIPETIPLFTPFLTSIPLQLFAYHVAAKRGADVDQPRNLAKSVTVE